MNNINKIKEECKDIDPNINYSSNNWEEEFIKKTDWHEISWAQNLSESFIEKNKNDVNWINISCYQRLSESFIEKYQNYIYWQYISWFQDLSESFIEKNKDKINFEWLFDNINITNEFIFDYIHWFINENIYKNSWRFDNKKFADKWNKYKKLFSN